MSERASALSESNGRLHQTRSKGSQPLGYAFELSCQTWSSRRAVWVFYQEGCASDAGQLRLYVYLTERKRKRVVWAWDFEASLEAKITFIRTRVMLCIEFIQIRLGNKGNHSNTTTSAMAAFSNCEVQISLECPNSNPVRERDQSKGTTPALGCRNGYRS